MKDPSPIPYVFNDPDSPLPFREVERIVRKGTFVDWIPVQVRLAQIGDRGKHQPEIHELICEMEGGLYCLFRVDGFGISQEYSPVSVQTHLKRQEAAYVCSYMMGMHFVPICATRENIALGNGVLTGTLTAMVEGEPFLHAIWSAEGKPSYRIPQHLQMPFAEICVLEALLGSGQRAESSLVLNPETRRIYSIYEHEAFSYTATERLELLFRRNGQTVSSAFLKKLERFDETPMKKERLKKLLRDKVHETTTEKFFRELSELLRLKKIGDTDIYVR